MSEPEMDQWATHLPAVLASLAATEGPVLECGVGIWSTPILHAACAPKKRPLVSVESKPDWLARFTSFATPWHEVLPIASWDDVPLRSRFVDDVAVRPWSVAFVDHGFAPRGPVVSRLRDHAQIVVMHDSDCAYSGYTKALRTFDWCWTHEFSPAWTTIAGMGAPPPWIESLGHGRWGVPVPYRG